MLLDISVPHQDYIEDCEVCCNPIRIMFDTEGENLISFTAESIEQ
ncbi:CPXCG motif-containing cysteine-rich protein [Fulvivirga ulvae]|nr:CPXCG motif-containing cysteine-rich protein [Fulvivirga ulvae]